jgi:arylsulfatase A-like enzyme
MKRILLSDFKICSPWVSTGTLLFSVTACQNNKSVVKENNSSPNIILILSDDQGYNDLGVYGARDIKTPNLDKLAKEGVRFTDFHVTCPISTPSRCSMLTGRYPQRNGTYELFRNDRVDEGYQYTPQEYSTSPERILGTDTREVFFPELLHNAGYVNGIFGKWDMGQLKRYLPLQRGFDQFYGFVNTGIDYYTHERYGVPSMYRNNEPTVEDKGIYSTYLFEREALRFIKENRDKRFFLYLPFNAPHGSSSLDPEIKGTVQAPPEYLARYPVATTVQERKRRGYMAATTCMDDAIGNILSLVDSLGLRENTLVIFFSDNGGGIGSDNSPLSGGKATMWEGGLRVPCIISWPGKIKEGQVIHYFMSSLEIFPTIMSAAGIEKPDSLILDGFNMLPLLTGEKSPERKEMYWELRGDYAVRIGDLKWIKSRRANGLFDLSKDIGEKTDISEREINSVSLLNEKFYSWKEEMNNSEPRGPFKDF